MYTVIKEKCLELGAVWDDKATVKEVFVDLDEESGRPIVAGVKL